MAVDATARVKSLLGERNFAPNTEARRALRRQKHLDRQLQLQQEAQLRAEARSILSTEDQGCLTLDQNDLKRIYHYRQDELLPQIDVGTQAKMLDLTLSFGPYIAKYSQNGRHFLIGGHKGSLALLDSHTCTSTAEMNTKETVYDVTFCHNETLWAAAQKKYVYLYDKTGLELHCLRSHMLTYRVEFLPYHFLLTTIGEFGELRWLDISTGITAAAYKTKLGPCDTMCQNRFTGVVGLGHKNGLLTYWTPNFGKPVLQFMGHRGKIECLEHITEHAVASAGHDGYWKIWDVRQPKHPLSWTRYHGGIPKDLSGSQTKLLALTQGSYVQIWKDVLLSKPQLYLRHQQPSSIIETVAFQPYEDVLVYGHSTGVATMIVPGSCHSSFDTFVADPYETKHHRREREVHALLDKLPPSTITFIPSQLGGFVDHLTSSRGPGRKRRKAEESSDMEDSEAEEASSLNKQNANDETAGQQHRRVGSAHELRARFRRKSVENNFSRPL